MDTQRKPLSCEQCVRDIHLHLLAGRQDRALLAVYYLLSELANPELVAHVFYAATNTCGVKVDAAEFSSLNDDLIRRGLIGPSPN